MKKFIAPILGAITLLSSSCSSLQSPELYEEEIRDCVKYYLATAAYIVDLHSNPFYSEVPLLLLAADDDLDKMGDLVLDTYNNSDMDYRAALVDIANDEQSDYQDEAQTILEHYDALQIDLSDYTSLRSSTAEVSWSFSELHSGVEFIFKIENPDDAQPTWSCYPVEKSLESYVEHLID